MSRLLSFFSAAAALCLSGCLSGSPIEPVESPGPTVPEAPFGEKPAHYIYRIRHVYSPSSPYALTALVSASGDSVLEVLRVVNGDTAVLLTDLHLYSLDHIEGQFSGLGADTVIVRRDSLRGLLESVTLDRHRYVEGDEFRIVIEDLRVEPAFKPRGDHAARGAKWANKPARFAYTLARECFCMEDYTGPFHVTATANAVQSVRRVTSNGDTVAVTTRLQDYSLDTLAALANFPVGGPEGESWVIYDPAHGFPSRLYIDWFAGVVDDEMGYRVRDFRVLP